jgi:ribonuclease-3
MSAARARPRGGAAADPARLAERLGVDFADPALLERALTHRSRAGKRNYERLEFLGDAFLGYVVAEELFRRLPEAREDEMSLMRASLVRGPTLAAIARELGLGDWLRLGTGEQKSGGHRRDSILSDVVEAIIGAVLLDAGEGPARALVLRLLGPRLDAARPGVARKDPKTRLQELLQGRGEGRPEYEVLEVAGSDHDQQFRVACAAGVGVRAEGRGRSRRAAEQAAAERVLAELDPEDA